MDREVLFRGKRMDNGKWVEGWYCPKKTGHYEGDRFVEEVQSIIIASMTGGGYQYAVVDPRTVCQHTGLTDKNGKQIFEGDIIRYNDEVIGKEKVDEVEYNETHAAFCRLHKSKMGLQYLWLDEVVANKSEVVGNIFDNPDFLEGGAE